ncbi:hypothetical protein FHU30_008779 [Actinomadura rupiterrae]|nr:hypothetical protein [Actinomadura rupiterrae]
MPAAVPVRGDRMIRRSTAVTVVALGGIAAVVSFRHALEVVRLHGESGITTYLTPLTPDGLVFCASMVLLDAARQGHRPPLLARAALLLGIAATMAVNVLHGWAHGLIGAVVGAWPAATLILVVELLMGMIRRRRTARTSTTVPAPTTATGRDRAPTSNPAGTASAPGTPTPARVPDPARNVPAEPRVPPTSTPAAVRLSKQDKSERIAQVRALPVGIDPAHVRAARVFAEELAAGQVPSIRRIKAALRCGQDKASQVRDYLSTLTTTPDAPPAAAVTSAPPAPVTKAAETARGSAPVPAESGAR